MCGGRPRQPKVVKQKANASQMEALQAQTAQWQAQMQAQQSAAQAQLQTQIDESNRLAQERAAEAARLQAEAAVAAQRNAASTLQIAEAPTPEGAQTTGQDRPKAKPQATSSLQIGQPVAAMPGAGINIGI